MASTYYFCSFKFAKKQLCIFQPCIYS